MKSFFKTLLATILGSFISLFITAVIIIAIVVGAIGGMTGALNGDSDEKALSENQVLGFTFSRPILERVKHSPFEKLDIPIQLASNAISLVDVKKAIKKAGEEDNIKAIFMNLSDVQASFAVIEEIRNTLIEFKKSGKKVYCYGEWMSEKAYYLASVSDKIFMSPEGILEFNGLVAEVLFFKKMLDKIGVEPIIFRVGKYKSAVEPLIREDMSEASKLQVSMFLEGIYNKVVADISTSRGIDQPSLRMISDSLKVRSIDDAVKYQLIDGAYYYDEVISDLKSSVGIGEDKLIKLTSIDEFLDIDYFEEEDSDNSKDHIAIVVAEGEIRDGKSDEGVVGSIDMSNVFRQLRKEDHVKAVVLRINSPGGSALASDVMWREIKETAKVKPVIASMSGMAASGGYYIAIACDEIIAHEHTITGSIGVFGVLANVQKLMEDKLGITTDRVKTGEFADLATPFRSMEEEDRAIIQNGVDRIYKTFITKVAKARNMKVSEVNEVAGGRVWTGLQAKEKGLVDKIGGLEDAIASAQIKIDKDLKIVYYPKYEGFWGKSHFDDQVKESILSDPDLNKLVESINNVKKMNGIQARMSFDLEIK